MTRPTRRARLDRIALPIALCCGLAASGEPPTPGEHDVLVSLRAEADFPLSADPQRAAWKDAPAVVAESDPQGRPVAGHRTVIRS